MKSFLLGLLLILLFLANSFGQPNYVDGYIITHEHDTVYGLVDSRGDIRSSVICNFKKTRLSSKEVYSPGEIHAYKYTGGKYYITKGIPSGDATRLLFLEYIADGIADLYYYRDKDNGYYFIQREGKDLVKLSNRMIEYETGNGELILRESKKYLTDLAIELSDAKYILPEISSTQFTHSSMAELIETYHNEKSGSNEEFTTYLYELPRVRIKYGLRGTYSETSLYYKSGPASDFDLTSERAPSISWMAEFTFPNFNERVFFRAIVEAGRQNYNSSYAVPNINDFESIYSLSRDINYVVFGSTANFSRATGIFRPYIGLGLGGQFNYTDQATRAATLYQLGIEQSYQEYDDVPTTGFVPLMLSQAGIKFHSLGRFVPFIEFRYIFGATSTKYGDVRGQIFHNYQTAGLAGGILF